MGRQVNVEIKDLVKAGCTIVPNSTTYSDWDELLGKVVEFESKYITVVIPGGNAISSYCEDSLVLDCRNTDSTNYWVEDWLKTANVPYIAG